MHLELMRERLESGSSYLHLTELHIEFRRT